MFWLLDCILATSRPMMAQVGPTWSQDGPEMGTRWSQDGHEMAPDGLRVALEINENPSGKSMFLLLHCILATSRPKMPQVVSQDGFKSRKIAFS